MQNFFLQITKTPIRLSDALADLSLCWAYMSEVMLSHVVAYFVEYSLEVLLQGISNEKPQPSRKHAYIILTPLNPTFI